MDNNTEDLIVQLRIRKSELKQLLEEKANVFYGNSKPSNNLRDLNENIQQCKFEISKIRIALKAMKDNILPSKNEYKNLEISKTLHTFA